MKFDHLNSVLKTEYELFLSRLKGAYLGFVAPGKTVDVSTVAEMKREGVEASARFIERLNVIAAEFVSSEGENLSQRDLDALSGIVSNTSTRVEVMLAHNVATVVKLLRESTGILASALNDDHGPVGQLISKRLSEVKFKALDDAGRNWDSEKLFAFYSRNMFYGVMINAEVLQAKASGVDLMEVYYEDPTHKNNGIIFSITGDTDGYPKLDELQTSVFHFNAKAEIKPYVFSKK